jgi:PAS domain S-box-containing protein
MDARNAALAAAEQFESEAAVRLWLADRLARETDPVAILKAVAEGVGRFLRAGRVGYGEIAPGEDWITIPIDWTDGIPSMVGRHPLFRESSIVQAYVRGRTLAVTDVADLVIPPAERDLLTATHCGSFVSVPLLHDDELVGLFSVTCPEPRDWTPAEVALVSHVAARTWAALQHARAVAKLAESEEQFRTLAENMPGLCWIADPAGMAVWMNGAGERFFDGTMRSIADTGNVIHPDDREDTLARWSAALASGTPVEAVVRMHDAAGVYFPFLSRAVPVLDAGGHVVRWCVTHLDLSDKEGLARRQAFLRTLVDRTRELGDVGQVLAAVSRMLGDAFGVDQISFTEATEDAPELFRVHRARRGAAIGEAGAPFRFGDHFAAARAAFVAGETVVVDDVAAVAGPAGEALRDHAAHAGVAAFVGVPLVKDGRLLAVFAMQAVDPRRWTADEVALAEEIAERLWAIVTRVEAEQQLAEREEQFRTLAENIPAMCWLADRDGRLVWGNRQWTQVFGTLVNVHGNLADTIHPDDRPRVLHSWFEAFRTGQSIESTISMRARDGRYRPYLSSAVPIHDPAGAVVRWCGVLVDLSEKHARDRHDAFFRQVSEAIRAETGGEAILATVADELKAHLGVARVMYSEVAESGGLFAVHRDTADPVHGTARGHMRLPPAFAPMLAAYGRGETVPIADTARLSPLVTPGVRDFLQGNGIRAALNVPLVKDGTLVAVLSAHHDQPRLWAPDEIKLIEELAERTWSTLTRARAEAEVLARERQSAFLLDWSDRVRSDARAPAILARTLERLGAHLGLARASYIEQGGDGGVRLVQDWVADSPGATGAGLTLDRIGPALRRAVEAARVVAIDDLFNDDRLEPEALELFAGLGIQALLAVPILRTGSAPALLALQAAAPRRWRRDEVQLLRDVADRVSVMLERANAEAALQERERAQAFLIAWGDQVRGETNPDRILATTLAALGQHLGSARAAFAEVDVAAAYTIVSDWSPGLPSLAGLSFPADNFSEAVRAIYLAGEPLVSGDLRHDERFSAIAREKFAANGVVARLGVPLARGGVLHAILSVDCTGPRTWTRDEVQLAREVADRAWVALERARAEAALQERERHQAFLLDWTDRLRGETNPDAILATTLRRIATHLGTTRANFAQAADDGRRFEILQEWRTASGAGTRREANRGAVSDGVHQAYFSGQVVSCEDVDSDPRFAEPAREAYRAVDAAAFLGIPLVRRGRVRAVLSVQQASPRRWAPSEVQLLRDVSERVWVMLERARAEAALQERERAQAFLIAWGDSVREETSPRAILARTLDQLGRHLGVSRCNYGETTRDGAGLAVLQEWNAGVIGVAGQEFPFAALGAKVIADHLTGRTLAVTDVVDHPLFDDVQETYRATDVRALISVPLVRDGRLVAVFGVQQSTPRAWTEHEQRLVSEIADRTWSTLERARVGERLAESEALLSTFMENAPIGMHLKDASGRYIRINPEQAVAAGVSVEELLGKHPDEIFTPEVAAVIEEVEAQARAGQLASAEFHGGSGERYKSVLSMCFPIPGQGVARTAGFTIDLTERKQAEAALERSREALYQTEKLSALGSLLAGVSHELNNPLSIVVAQAVMMERQAKGTEIAERALKVRRAADRCARIVQTFLAMARQKRPERAPVDLNQVAAAALELADYGLKTEGVVVTQALAADLPTIMADADQLHQIVINLVINAQQAMVEAATPLKHVTVATRRGPEPHTVVLEVSDTGPGVPADARRRIFEPFYTTKPQGEGTGVGLSFSQGLAEAHGGRLQLVPTPTGATFRLTLPISAAVSLPVAGPDDAPTESAEAARRALVIDDEAEIAESLADFLSIEGFDCEVAVGGAAGKARLAQGQYDLVVSDLRMPEVDGPALHAWLVEARPDLAQRIAFTTGDTLGIAAARFLAEVDRPVLEKPFMPDAVHRLLEQMELA